MRVLVSAYACEPGRGSEPGVGWNWVRQIARHNQTWIITRWNNREPIERALEDDPLPNANFVYFDLPGWARWWKKGRRGLRLYYYLWQIAAYFKAARLHKKIDFHLAHHVTFVTYWLPSFLAWLPIPFVWGPVGGGESTPASFRPLFSIRGRLFEFFRDLVRSLCRLDPFVMQTAHHASLALASTSQTADRLHQLGCRRVQVYSSMGVPANEIDAPGSRHVRPVSSPFRFVEIGDLLHWKGCELALRGFAIAAQDLPAAEFWLIGDGPERGRLEKLAVGLGVMDRVKFWGRLPRPSTLAKLAECDVLVHPSVHDSGGGACTEALAAGRPVICLDLGGPALQVTPDCGIKIPAISPQQAIDDLAAAMKELAFSPDRWAALSRGARRRVDEDLAWDLKGEQMAAMYRDLVGKGASELVGSVAQYTE